MEGTHAQRLGGRYLLGSLIGRGGMADVHRATDEVLGREVAVKLLREVASDPADRTRFTAEARTLAPLNHPSLVTVLDAGTEDDRPYLVLELVEGPTLAEVLPLPAEQVARMAAQLAAGLAHVHAAGVVHRDVKPGNVLLGEDGRARIADFGIARLLADTTRNTRTGMTIGTAAYLAPEQVRGEDITPAADVYSFGLVLLEALTGTRAYPGSAVEAAAARLHAPPPIPAELPAGWHEILTAMTQLDPGRRPTTADVAAALARLADGRPAADLTGPEASQRHDATATRRLTGLHDAPGASAAGTEVLHAPARTAWWPPRISAAAAAAAVGVVLVGALLLWAITGLGDAPAEQADRVPPGVPAQLEEPLTDLHDAVHGDGQ